MRLLRSRRLLRHLGFALVPAFVCAGCSAPARRGGQADRARWTFDDQTAQRLPTGWRIAATNPTAAMATWQVVADRTAPTAANVFALTKSENYDGTFNLAIADAPTFTDLDLTVRAKAVAGKEDQGGGPIWRVQDANNYYICRFNPLEANFRVYVVSHGKRRQLQSVKVALAADRWYEIRIRMVGDEITCYLDGQKQLEARDTTIPQAGKVGLWTKADAVTSFDDLEVRVVPRQE